MKLRRSVFVTAILAVVLSLATIPMSATAVTQPIQATANQPYGWPKPYDAPTTSFIAIDDGKVVSANCSDVGATNNSMTYSDYSGITTHQSAVPPHDTSLAVCADSRINDQTTGYAAGADGAMYTNARQSDNSWHLEKYKNGIKLWDVALPVSATNCSSSSRYPNQNLIMQSMSIGSDGYIYGILKYESVPSACSEWLFSLNSYDGSVRFKNEIATSFNGRIASRVWSYPSNLLVQKNDGTIHQYDYNGTEDTSKQFALTAPSGKHLVQSIADSSEGVYGVFAPDNNGYTQVTYSSPSGSSTPVDTSFSGYDEPRFNLGGEGRLVTVQYGNIYHTDVTGNTSTITPINLPYGYTNQTILSYMEDMSGVGVLVRKVSTNSPNSNTIRVDKIDSVTDAYTNLFNLTADPGLSFNPTTSASAIFSSDNVYGNNLYLPICFTNIGCTGDPSTQDVALYSIALTGLGDIVNGSNTQHSPFRSTEMNYVVLGDSYSSGEGVNPYVFGTDTVNNKCHRSEESYAVLLDKRVGVNLNLTSSVTCSGAVLSDISNPGQYNEIAQLASIGLNTDIVTVTIGGNDVLFGPTLTECTMRHNLPADAVEAQDDYDSSLCTAALSTSADVVNGVTLVGGKTFSQRLQETYSSISSKGNSSTQYYILGYPNLFPSFNEITASSCTWGYTLGAGGTSTRPVTEDDTIALRGLLDDITYKMGAAISALNKPNVHFVDVRGGFAGHEICSSNPYITHVDVNGDHKGSYHPNEAGQAKYADILEEITG